MRAIAAARGSPVVRAGRLRAALCRAPYPTYAARPGPPPAPEG